MTRRLLALLVLTAGLVPVGGGTAWACVCWDWDADDARRVVDERAEAVYVGEIVRVERSHYVVRVDRGLAGDASGVRRLHRGGSCDKQLRPGRVFMTELDGTPGHCETLTTQQDVDAAAARYLANRVPPAPAPPPLDRTGAVLAAALLVALAGGAAVASARRAG